MSKSCAQCRQTFDITNDDLAFYEKVSPEFDGKKYLIPAPTLCPDCRQQRRMSWRNERNLYHRKSDKSGQQMISVYRPDSHKVYTQTEWWGDDWDALDYGMDYDPSRPFFAQFHDLLLSVPRLSLTNKKQENSEYCNQSESMKNCYLLFGSIYSQDCYYGARVTNCKDCVDCLWIHDSEECYECVDCKNCTNVLYSWNCADTHDAMYAVDCTNSHDILFCAGRKRVQHQVLNIQYSPDEYKKLRDEIISSPEKLNEYKARFAKLLLIVPVKATIGTKMEDCTGNYITESSNAQNVFGVIKMQDVKYVYDAFDLKDGMDVYSLYGPAELCYELHSAGVGMSRCAFLSDCWPGDNLLYCDHCFNCKDCFGCSGLRRKRYCILNKQYTKAEYEELVPKIIEQMKKSKEWGEFFPTNISPFAYNESVAHEYFPLTQKEITSNGWSWVDEEDTADLYLGPKSPVPPTIDEVSDDITKKILTCEVSGKPYKIIPQELKFYREMNIPIPRKCPDQRHKERMALRNPRKLWKRNCGHCKKEIETTYAPDRPEIVYCERCYLETVY